MSIKSLAALKMEKNFKAVIDKGYPRQPYKSYSIVELFDFVEREMKELQDAFKIGSPFRDIREEIADVSNCLDYLYESVLSLEVFK
jgi:hypothetical protein